MFTKRIALLALALLMLVTMLSGCGGCGSTTVETIEYDSSKLTAQGSLSNSNLNKIAKMIQATHTAENDVYGSLENAEDEAAAYTVIETANGKAGVNEKLTENELKTIKNGLRMDYVEVLLAALTVVDTGVLDYSADVLLEWEDTGVDHALLTKIAKVIQAAYPTYDAQIGLIVAKYGQDPTNSKTYNPDYKPTGDEKMNLEGAYHVIKKANDTVASLKKDGKTDVSPLSAEELKKIAEETKETVDGEEVTTVTVYLKEQNVESLINAFRTPVASESEGFFGGILAGIGMVLGWITRTLGFGSYVVGICIFAILIELLMLPFAIKQQKNSIKQAKLRPKEMAIRNKYKGRNDQPTMQKMQAEIQELYQRENFSPFNGCWTLLIQLPIIIALYNIVVDPLRYVFGHGEAVSQAINRFASAPAAAGGLGLNVGASNGTISLLSNLPKNAFDKLGDFLGRGFTADQVKDLRAMEIPNFNIGSINFGRSPNEITGAFGDWTAWILLLVPILTFATYFVTAKLNRKFMYQSVMNDDNNRQVACSNKMMDITMPAMSAFFTFAVPSVIGVYWAFRSWLGFGKTVIMAKAMPLPTFTEEDYKAAAKEMAGKKTVKKSERAGAVRSLHYIDDEDFEDTRERGMARRAAIEEREKKEREAKEAMRARYSAPVKKDRKPKAEDAPAKQAEEKPEADKDQKNDNDKDEV